jgi:hypothetical protein
MKLLVRILAGLFVLLLIGALVAFLMLDSIVRSAVEKGGAHATGTQVKLAGADLSLRGGKLDLSHLSIHNPDGFRDEPFVSASAIHAAWENGTIFSDELVIDEIALDGIQVNLERTNGRTNFGKILQHIESLGGKKGPAEPSEGAQRTLVVKRILVTNVKAAVHLEGIPLSGGTAEVIVPRVEIDDFRTDGTTKEIVAKLTGAVVQAVLSSTLEKGDAILPKEILHDLKGNLDSLKSQANDALKDVRKGLDDVKDIFKKK